MMIESDFLRYVVSLRSPAKGRYHLAGAAVLLLLCLLFVFPAVVTAGAVVVDTDSLSTADGVTTIPVYLTDAEDILSFAVEVANTQPGVVISISETMQSESGMTVVNTNPANTAQRVAWISTAGVTADKMLMFAIEVTVTDPTVTSVPLEVTLTEIASDEKGMLPVSNYPVSSSTVQISGTGSESSSGGDKVTPTQQPTPSVPENPVPTLTDTPDEGQEPENVPTTPSDSLPLSGELETPTSAETPQSPGMSAVLVLLSLGFAVVLKRR